MRKLMTSTHPYAPLAHRPAGFEVQGIVSGSSRDRVGHSYVSSTPHLGEDLIVFHVWTLFPNSTDRAVGSRWYNLGQVLACKYFDHSRRTFVVTTALTEEHATTDEEKSLLVELAEGVASPN